MTDPARRRIFTESYLIRQIVWYVLLKGCRTLKLKGQAMAFRFARWTSLVFIVFLGSIALFGVSAQASRRVPIYTVTNHPIPLAAQRLPAQTVEQTIIDAALSYHWHIDSKGPGTIAASYERRRHQVAIAITFSRTAYSITLVHSSGMHEKDGEINHNYNSWISHLEGAIEDRLSAASASGK